MSFQIVVRQVEVLMTPRKRRRTQLASSRELYKNEEVRTWLSVARKTWRLDLGALFWTYFSGSLKPKGPINTCV